MSRIGSLAAFLAGVLSAGCISWPTLPELSPEQLALTERAPRSGLVASLDCVRDGIRFEMSCPMALEEAQRLLAKSYWLARVGVDEPDPDLRLTVHAPVRSSYWSEPPNNPGFFLLSIAIPFWWSKPFGFRIDATRVETGKTVTLDTTFEGTVILWSGAMILNALPSRAFVPDEQRELDQLHLQMLALFAE